MGYPFPISLKNQSQIAFEPQAQLIYQRLNIRSIQEAASLIRFSQNNSLRGRLGLRIPYETKNQRTATIALIGSLWKEFFPEKRTIFSNLQGLHPTPFRVNLGKAWGEAGLEGTLRLFGCTDLYANAYYEHVFNAGRKAVGGNVGIRAHW